MTQHTKGPWVAAQNGALGYVIQAGRTWGKGEVALISHYAAEPAGTDYANARLIAAAPELLAALEAIKASLPNYTSENHSTRDGWTLRTINYAINKARGA